MKVIEKSTASVKQENALGGLFENVQQTLGLAGETERQAEEILIGRLRVLPAPWTMLRQVRLPGLEMPVPLVLIGPSGVYAVVASPIKGVFQVKEESWSEMAAGEKEFTPARLNLVTLTQQFTQEVEAFIAQKGYEIPPVQGLLFFSNPGIHVDAVRPVVRILQVDAIDRFVSSLVQNPSVFSPEDVHILVQLFDEPEPAAAIADFEPEQPEVEQTPAVPVPSQPSAFSKAVDSTMSRLAFTRSQWVIIGLAVLANIVLLIILIVAYILIY